MRRIRSLIVLVLVGASCGGLLSALPDVWSKHSSTSWNASKQWAFSLLTVASALTLALSAGSLGLASFLSSTYERYRVCLESTLLLGLLPLIAIAVQQCECGAWDVYQALAHFTLVSFFDLPIGVSIAAVTILGPMYLYIDWHHLTTEQGIQLTWQQLASRQSSLVCAWVVGVIVMQAALYDDGQHKQSKRLKRSISSASSSSTCSQAMQAVVGCLEDGAVLVKRALSPQDRTLIMAVLLCITPVMTFIMGIRPFFDRSAPAPGPFQLYISFLCMYLLGTLEVGTLRSGLARKLAASQELLCDLLPRHVVRSLLEAQGADAGLTLIGLKAASETVPGADISSDSSPGDSCVPSTPSGPEASTVLGPGSSMTSAKQTVYTGTVMSTGHNLNGSIYGGSRMSTSIGTLGLDARGSHSAISSARGTSPSLTHILGVPITDGPPVEPLSRAGAACAPTDDSDTVPVDPELLSLPGLFPAIGSMAAACAPQVPSSAPVFKGLPELQEQCEDDADPEETVFIPLSTAAAADDMSVLVKPSYQQLPLQGKPLTMPGYPRRSGSVSSVTTQSSWAPSQQSSGTSIWDSPHFAATKFTKLPEVLGTIYSEACYSAADSKDGDNPSGQISQLSGATLHVRRQASRSESSFEVTRDPEQEPSMPIKRNSLQQVLEEQAELSAPTTEPEAEAGEDLDATIVSLAVARFELEQRSLLAGQPVDRCQLSMTGRTRDLDPDVLASQRSIVFERWCSALDEAEVVTGPGPCIAPSACCTPRISCHQHDDLDPWCTAIDDLDDRTTPPSLASVGAESAHVLMAEPPLAAGSTMQRPAHSVQPLLRPRDSLDSIVSSAGSSGLARAMSFGWKATRASIDIMAAHASKAAHMVSSPLGRMNSMDGPSGAEGPDSMVSPRFVRSGSRTRITYNGSTSGQGMSGGLVQRLLGDFTTGTDSPGRVSSRTSMEQFSTSGAGLEPGAATDINKSLVTLAEWHEECTILFCDVVGFTTIAQQVHPRSVMSMLNDLYTRFDNLCLRSGEKVYKVETIGDCYMLATGLLHPDPQHALTALEFAFAMRREAAKVKVPLPEGTVLDGPHPTVQIRIGLHSGRAMSGIVGKIRRRYCLFGDSINTASRMESAGAPNAVHLSDDTHALLSAGPLKQAAARGISFTCRGRVLVKGKGEMTTWWAHAPGEAPHDPLHAPSTAAACPIFPGQQSQQFMMQPSTTSGYLPTVMSVPVGGTPEPLSLRGAPLSGGALPTFSGITPQLHAQGLRHRLPRGTVSAHQLQLPAATRASSTPS